MRHRFSRKGLSGLISAIFLFAMLFTTGAAYIYFVTDSQFKLQDSAKSTLQREMQQKSESALLNTSKLSNNHLGTTITNTGTEPIQVKQMFVLDGGGHLLKNIQSPILPVTLNSQSAKMIDTNLTVQQGTNYTVKAVTDRGSLFSAVYPPQSSTNVTSIVTSAISSQIARSIGSVAMDTTTLQYSQDGGITWKLGWNVPGGVNTIWRINVTNMYTHDIYLANYSSFLLLKIVSGGGGQLQPQTFYIVKTASATTYPKLDSNFIANGGIMLPANSSITKTLYLKIDNPGSGSIQQLSAGTRYMVTLELFGKYDSATSSSYYGQSLPFVGVLTP